MMNIDCVNSSGAAVAPSCEEARVSGFLSVRGVMGMVFSALRYRYFIIAGIFPYSLGWAAAFGATGRADWLVGVLGLSGVVFISLGIEGMNEYFDAKLGGDRAFASIRRIRLWWHLPLGLGGFAGALAVGVCLSAMRGWAIMAFAIGGGVIALSYLMPPVHLSHRGGGEAAIAVGYGPGLTLGAFYLQTGQWSWHVALLSLVPALVMFAMALANEVPDYHGDRLVGKRNLIVRLGRRGGVVLSAAAMALCFGLIGLGVLLRVFPLGLSLCMLLIPVVFFSIRHGLKYCEQPNSYIRVIRTMILMFMAINTVAILSYIIGPGVK